MHLRLLPLLALFMLWWSAPAEAFSCSFSNTGINFGNVNLSGGFQTAAGTFTADCTGTPGEVIRICPNFNEGSGGSSSGGSPRLMSGPSAAQLRYDLFQTNGVGKVWGSYTWGYSPRPPVLLVTINNSGFGSVSQAIYGRLYNQQGALGPGTYTSSFAGSQTQIDYGLSANFNCSSALSARVQNVPFIVRTTNNASCTVAATNMDFGSRLQLDSAVTATNTITATCTYGTQFQIGLSNGTSGAILPNSRRMLGAVTPWQMVQYQIYRDAGRTQQWGSTIGTNTVSATATGVAQTFNGYGLVPAQATPYSQLYTDNLVVTITY